MSFSKEDHAAWENCEVMMELEKYANELLEVEKEDEKTWEDENNIEEERLKEVATDILEEQGPLDELFASYNDVLVYNLNKLAETLADNKQQKIAYKIERTIQSINDFVREEK